MRQIKFRFYDKLEEEMVYSNKSCLSEFFDEYDNSLPNVEIMQFTGLFDKQGKEIYEGDIVIEKSYPFFGNAPEIESSDKKCDELNYVGVVVWDDGYYVDLKAVSNRTRGSAIGQSLYDYESLEIIGSIYENPELLESK